jgi:hypothetical protein
MEQSITEYAVLLCGEQCLYSRVLGDVLYFVVDIGAALLQWQELRTARSGLYGISTNRRSNSESVRVMLRHRGSAADGRFGVPSFGSVSAKSLVHSVSLENDPKFQGSDTGHPEVFSTSVCRPGRG